MPLSQALRDDKLIWCEEKNSKFNVWSTYYLIQSHRVELKGESSHHHDYDQLWKKIWQLRVPNKVCIFAWWGCKNGLPTLSKLRKKQVAVDSKCNFCHDQEGDLAHALFYFLKIREWWYTFLHDMEAAQQGLIFLKLIKWVQGRGENMVFTKFLMISWGFWSRCNSKIFKE